MRRTTFAIAIIGSTLGLVAAAAAEGPVLVVEEYVGDGWFENGYDELTTWRIYADFPDGVPDDEGVLAVGGYLGSSWEVRSSDGLFHNAPGDLNSHTAPVNYTPYYWENQWDTYVTIGVTDAQGDATSLSPGFAEEVNYLASDFSTENAAYFVSIDNWPQGSLDEDGRILLAQFVVSEGVTISGSLNLLTHSNQSFYLSFGIYDLDVDTDRDGDIDGDDDAEEDEWTNERGALFAVNCDDDDGDNNPDGLEFTYEEQPGREDPIINGVADIDDITPFIIRAVGKKAGKKYWLTVPRGQIRKVHITPEIAAGKTWEWGGRNETENTFDITQWVKEDEDVTFGIEGLYFRYTKLYHGMEFDGYLDLKLQVKDANTGEPLGDDKVRLRVAPFLLLPNSQKAEEFYVSDHVDAADLRAALGTINANVDPYNCWLNSQWAQDPVEIGFTATPLTKYHVAGYTKHHLGTHPEGEVQWVRDKLLRQSRGIYRLPGGTTENSYDYGGNIELLPPTTKHKLGQICVGNCMSELKKGFLRSQELQPVIELDTKWLHVGHVDEILGFYKKDDTILVIIASPKKAYEKLNSPLNGKTSYESERLPDDAVFFAIGETAGGTVTDSSPDMLIDVDTDFSAYPWKYVRIYDACPADIDGDNVVDDHDLSAVLSQWGQANVPEDIDGDGIVDEADMIAVLGAWGCCSRYGEGQVARIIERGPGYIRIDVVWGPYDLFPATGGSGSNCPGGECALGYNPEVSFGGWFELPQAGSRYVLVEDSLTWNSHYGSDADDLPSPRSVVDVKKVVRDKKLRAFNRNAQDKINAARKLISKATQGEKVEFLEVPVIYTGHLQPDGTTAATAWNPGLTNFVVNDGKFLFPSQHGPPAGPASDAKDIYEDAVRKELAAHGIKPPPGARQKVVFFVEDWNLYHRLSGEIHCGSNARRKIFDFKWWESLD